jgi:hypothetical protein
MRLLLPRTDVDDRTRMEISLLWGFNPDPPVLQLITMSLC